MYINYLRTYEKIKNQYKLTMIEYNSLKMAIPTIWRTFSKDNHKGTYFPMAPHNYDQCINVYKKGLAGKIYSTICSDITFLQDKFNKWKNELGNDFCETVVEFGLMHLDIHRITNVAKYRSFQYRISQRGIVTNIPLRAWNMRPNDNCTFCNQ